MPQEWQKEKHFLGERWCVDYTELNTPGWYGSLDRCVHSEGVPALVKSLVKNRTMSLRYFEGFIAENKRGASHALSSSGS